MIRGTVDDPALLRHAAERALVLGREVAGTTGPNPPVGCVLLRDGRIVGEGATTPVGGPHAEAVALAAAGASAAGATAVVTLEPCAHASQRGPACADLIVAARPQRVVVGQQHSHPLASTLLYRNSRHSNSRASELASHPKCKS